MACVRLPCHQPFVDFLADELLPWARERYQITSDPAGIIAAGQSYGGLAAAFAGLRRPEVFGNVLSQSGSFWWKPEGDEEHEWLTRQYAESNGGHDYVCWRGSLTALTSTAAG